ncbi:MAG: alkaline phosphatase [Candidatus Yanofskybacteria bacterium CG10_big_fil_rev_8_21_14_0_10_46_23]|uniref:Alkaline phosphatase n=1 Tax=Candidatus Yanofskybacteria bacterium CG10_big_fil_rev_8_21_14_0_10_46_23 TaxID=1975098 RepID=A0A2H0R407_9BACT|nr:MAG: alkaline phosphatase [Candidatus Yanofskybacteria bacterium CG10_big_fil_rev_8_21_14_0_10_46_23]
MDFVFRLIGDISQWALDIISQFGYLGIFIISFLESAVFPPIPSELVLPFAGFLVSQGQFNFWLVLLTVSLANLAGGLLIYGISASGGRWILEKYGRYIFIRRHEIDHVEKIFGKYGPAVVFFGRVLPLIRTLISVPAGLVKMPLLRFSIFTFFGSFLWNFALVGIGLKAGENWDLLGDYFQRFDSVIIGVLLILVVGYIFKNIRRKK